MSFFKRQRANEVKADRPRRPQAPEPKCGNCRFSIDYAGDLTCRRYPPPTGMLQPLVDENSWCGEHDFDEEGRRKLLAAVEAELDALEA